MKKYNYREIFIIVMVILMIFCIAVVLTAKKRVNKKDYLYVTGNTKLKINNSTPLSDEIGKKEKSKDHSINFNIKGEKLNSNKVKYEIFVKQINSANSINDKYVKVYLMENNTSKPLINKPITFNKLLGSSKDIDAKQIYMGSIKKGDSISVKYKMWLADTYTISTESKDFEVMIGVNIVN